MIKAAFFDIDGTLVSMKTHRMTDNVLDTLYVLKEKGIKLFIASGRPPQIIDNLRDFPFDGIISMNGALVIADGEIIYRRPIERDSAIRIAEISNANKIPAFISTESLCGVNLMNDISWEMFRLIKIAPPQYIDIEDIASKQNIYQATVYATVEEEERLIVPYVKNVDFPRWHPAFSDIVPGGIDKAEAIGTICRHYGIDIADTIAFGDGGNDKGMLQAAGIGIAMGNAVEEVKAAADMTTLSVEEDGIVAALKKLSTMYTWKLL